MRKVISLLLPQAQRDNTVPNLQQFSLEHITLSKLISFKS